jgi:hypothetical protein
MARINVKFADSDNRNYRAGGGGSQYLVQIPSNGVYFFYIDTNSDLVLAKSKNNGLTWDEPIRLIEQETFPIMQHSIWYDGWSDINSNLIHIVYVTSAVDYFYVNYNILTDTLSTPVTVINYPLSVTVAGNFGGLSITRAKGGNLGIYYNFISSTYRSGFAKSTDTGSSWVVTSSLGPGNPNPDLLENAFLLPELSSDDSQDMVMFTLTETKFNIFRKFYDNSLNTWFTSSFGSGSIHLNPTSNGGHYLSAFSDLVNSQSVLIAWNQSGYASPATALGAQLRCYTITSSSITTKTSVITSSAAGVGGQGPCGLTWNMNDNTWYAFYGGKSTGGENLTNMNIYYKKSTDQGITWSSETRFTSDLPTFLNTQSFGLLELRIPPITSGSDNMVVFMGNSDILTPQKDFNPYYINTFLPTAGGSIVVT